MTAIKPVGIAAVAALGLGFSAVALAADPESGTLTLDSGPIEFTSGPNVGVNPTPQAEPACVDVLLPCDHFALTIDLPDDIGEVFPSALIKMNFSWDDPTGSGAEDYDIYMYDLDGNEVNSAATGNNPEVMTQLAFGGVQEFNFDIIYFSVLGSTYVGRVELELGEPAEDADTDAFFEENSVLGRYLEADRSGESAESGNDYTARRSASGAMGGSLFGLFALMGLRRRRAR